MAGHDGSPDKPPLKKNFIRLREAGTQKVLAQSAPPRNDLAQAFAWDLAKHAGKKGYLEIVDGNTGHSFAWLAAGRFNPEVVTMPKVIPNQVDKRQLAAAELASALKLVKLEPRLLELVADGESEVEARGAAAKAICGFMADGAEKPQTSNSKLQVLGKILGDAEEPIGLREKIAGGAGGIEAARGERDSAEGVAHGDKRIAKGNRAGAGEHA